MMPYLNPWRSVDAIEWHSPTSFAVPWQAANSHECFLKLEQCKSSIPSSQSGGDDTKLLLKSYWKIWKHWWRLQSTPVFFSPNGDSFKMAMRALFYGLVPLAASINWEKACVQVARMELEKKDFRPTRWLETIHKSWYIMIHDAWIFSSWYFAFPCATGSRHWQPMVRNWMTCILEFGWVQKWGICTIQKRSKKCPCTVFAYKTYLLIEITEITRHVFLLGPIG